MRIAIDGTPAAVQHAGVGRYTRELLSALMQQQHGDQYQVLCAGNQAAAQQLERELPPGQWRSIRRIPVSDRWTTAVWQRLRLPVPADLFLDEPDVFHGPDFVLPPTRTATVVTIHDVSYLVRPEYAEPSLAAYLRTAVPRALRQADRVIAVSASVAAELATAYPECRERIVAIPNGVSQRPLGTAVPRQPGEAPTVLTVGTIEPRKNHLTLLDAMDIVRIKRPEAQLVIAGRTGWRSDAIVQRIRQAELAGTVKFIEAPDDYELRSLYREADVTVYASFYEGFGLPVLEAMSHGVPVVASDILVLRETGADAAVYAPVDNAEALADRILQVLDDNLLREALVRAGHRRVEEHSWDETARRTRRTYQAAIERHRHG